MALLVAGGLTNGRIGLKLAIGEGTVKTHGVHLLGKPGVSRQAHAVSLAIELGLRK